MSTTNQVPSPAPGGGAGKQRRGRIPFTTVEFVADAQAMHGVSTYDYSKTVYMSARHKVTIICSTHGAFEQLPPAHVKGHGCRLCGNTGRKALSLSDFISRAQQAHGADRYDYSLVRYKPNAHKVSITCPEHGVFKQNPFSHMNGCGCPKCASVQRKRIATYTLDSFISQAKAVHGPDMYDYSQVVYRGCFEKIDIICAKHGVFMQSANSHKRGSRCPNCVKEAQALSWAASAAGRVCTLYFIRLFDNQESFFKVGITHTSIQTRYSPKKALNGYQYEIIAQHTSSNAVRIYDWEQSIIGTFAHLQYKPNRLFNGATECFSSADEILAIFPL